MRDNKLVFRQIVRPDLSKMTIKASVFLSLLAMGISVTVSLPRYKYTIYKQVRVRTW